ncbi:tRNA (adenosine(37)-N6)-threonylcarbamoyltransferase complex dimerization subunit type 1 TsaB [Spiribacter vilamensis]|uniref:tRNA threonylcarbamoyladenosine biosynthesis protein TsaB n=1 Tax=Spiribacter vilamensis TaxID=531306 RepID=A0A4Q8CYJ2_9GAMM|nr:tRNA (adenosine(37)-N6)-threonylcarbamoyltransferase complex dimerization subunit type 1 TsaB [Spiribacter vilamensis]RZU98051.1 tRNA threonylcarbamoyladenosine biosynthesis protein TsaB [Spiribacter vilamensis]TVO61046.1 tRNA (adenosine(37)-N6)-threonylcarbamoyltransferase complex dimerization subunit type 1 TsaB [Spiribacter vilamensis]
MKPLPVILGIDATTGICSVALGVNGSVRTRTVHQRKGQTSTTLAFADELLAEAGLGRSAIDAIACTRGPGGFTGVRISTGIGQGLALGLDRPVVGLSTLRVVAETALQADAAAAGALVMLDARMGEIYGGMFRRGVAEGESTTAAVTGEWLGAPVSPTLPAGRWIGAGSGFAAYPPLADATGLIGVWPDCAPDMGAAMPLARRCLEEGDSLPGERLEPVYLRNRVAQPAQGFADKAERLGLSSVPGDEADGGFPRRRS